MHYDDRAGYDRASYDRAGCDRASYDRAGCVPCIKCEKYGVSMKMYDLCH
jgi:hypothetical protein